MFQFFQSPPASPPDGSVLRPINLNGKATPNATSNTTSNVKLNGNVPSTKPPLNLNSFASNNNNNNNNNNGTKGQGVSLRRAPVVANGNATSNTTGALAGLNGPPVPSLQSGMGMTSTFPTGNTNAMTKLRENVTAIVNGANGANGANRILNNAAPVPAALTVPAPAAPLQSAVKLPKIGSVTLHLGKLAMQNSATLKRRSTKTIQTLTRLAIGQHAPKLQHKGFKMIKKDFSKRQIVLMLFSIMKAFAPEEYKRLIKSLILMDPVNIKFKNSPVAVSIDKDAVASPLPSRKPAKPTKNVSRSAKTNTNNNAKNTSNTSNAKNASNVRNASNAKNAKNAKNASNAKNVNSRNK